MLKTHGNLMSKYVQLKALSLSLSLSLSRSLSLSLRPSLKWMPSCALAVAPSLLLTQSRGGGDF